MVWYCPAVGVCCVVALGDFGFIVFSCRLGEVRCGDEWCIGTIPFDDPKGRITFPFLVSMWLG